MFHPKDLGRQQIHPEDNRVEAQEPFEINILEERLSHPDTTGDDVNWKTTAIDTLLYGLPDDVQRKIKSGGHGSATVRPPEAAQQNASADDSVFGANSSHDEDSFYTVIDSTDLQYKEQAARVEHIAREFEQSPTVDVKMR